MTLKVNNKEYTLKYGFKCLMVYENIAKKTFAPETTTDMLVFFYSCIVAYNQDCDLEFDDFIDFLDQHPEELTKFSEWLTAISQRNNNLNPSVSESDIKEVKKQSKKNS